MTQEQFEHLKRGDVIRSPQTGHSYVVHGMTSDKGLIAVHSFIAYDWSEWELVDLTPQPDPFEKWLRGINHRSHGACGWDDNDMREAFKAGQEAANTTSAPTQAHCSICGERVPEADAQLRSAVCGLLRKVRCKAVVKTSATIKPPLPDYAFSMERGLDPWHREAFPPGLKDRAPNQGPCWESGWLFLDAWENVVGFVPDGTKVSE